MPRPAPAAYMAHVMGEAEAATYGRETCGCHADAPDVNCAAGMAAAAGHFALSRDIAAAEIAFAESELQAAMAKLQAAQEAASKAQAALNAARYNAAMAAIQRNGIALHSVVVSPIPLCGATRFRFTGLKHFEGKVIACLTALDSRGRAAFIVPDYHAAQIGVAALSRA